MTKRFGQCCIGIALFVLVGCKDSKLADDPEWLNNTYNLQAHGMSGWHVRGSEKLGRGTIDSFTNDGCRFEFHINDNSVSSESSEILTSMILKFNLRDIDPDSVNVKTYTHYGGFNCATYTPEQIDAMGLNCDYAEMTASTRNAKPVVEGQTRTTYLKLTGKDHETLGNDRGHEVFLGFDDPEYAKKFASVFQDAIRRCGGTKGAAS